MASFPFRGTLSTFRFFHSQAGYVVGHHAEGALHLARAEQIAESRGWKVQWSADEDPDLGEHAYWCSEARREAAKLPGTKSGHSHEVLVATLVDSGGVPLASLGSIIDPSSAYARVIAAELALEAVERLDRLALNDRLSIGYMAL